MRLPLTEIPNPDDLLEQLVKTIFGPAATITILFLLLKTAWSWYEMAKSGTKLARATYQAASAASRRLRRGTVVAIFAAVTTTVMLLILQILWLWISYVTGNALSYLVVGPIPAEGPEWPKVMESLKWDSISTGYVTASTIGLIIMYTAALKGREALWVPTALSFPALLWGSVCLLGSALALLLATLYWISEDHFTIEPPGKAMMLMTLMSLIQIIACYSVMSTPNLMMRVWRSVHLAR